MFIIYYSSDSPSSLITEWLSITQSLSSLSSLTYLTFFSFKKSAKTSAD